MILVKNYVITSADWTPIVALIDCDYFSIWNTPGGWKGHLSADAILCSDPNDPDTQKPLSNGAQEYVTSTAPKTTVVQGAYRLQRFKAGDVFYYAKSAGADTILILTCLS